MIVLLSPAKTLDYTTPTPTQEFTIPEELEKSEKLIKALKKYSVKKLSDLMSLSTDLSQLNVGRYQTWNTDFTPENARQAIFAFKGEVYNGLQAYTFSQNDIAFAQNHIRLLSGLHGALKPLDLIQPYRLEMGTKLKVGRKNNLYEFWGDEVTQRINKQLEAIESEVVINLASAEYFKVINTKKLKAKVVTPNFYDNKNGTYKMIQMYAKKMRGAMAAFIVKNQLKHPNELQAFDGEGYYFKNELSTAENLVFHRG